MLLWKELVNEAQESEHAPATSKDDLKLLQIYLCRLFLSLANLKKPAIFRDDEPLEFLGLTPETDEEAEPGNSAYLRAILLLKHPKAKEAIRDGQRTRQALTAEDLKHLDHLTPGLIRAGVQSIRLRGLSATHRAFAGGFERRAVPADGRCGQPAHRVYSVRGKDSKMKNGKTLWKTGCLYPVTALKDSRSGGLCFCG